MNAPIDTLEAAKRLRAAGFDEQQVETLTHLFRDVQGIDLTHLATKADLQAELRQFATKADLQTIKADLRDELKHIKADLRDELRHFATNAGLQTLRADLFRAMLGQTIVIVGMVVGLLKLLGH